MCYNILMDSDLKWKVKKYYVPICQLEQWRNQDLFKGGGPGKFFIHYILFFWVNLKI